MGQTASLEAALKALIRNVPDFPKKGILFRDVTTFLLDGQALQRVVGIMAEEAKASGAGIIACVEARGFLFGPAVAASLGLGVVPIRKPGKLPAETRKREYTLEYGTDALEVHTDGIRNGQRVYIVDDLLATGGTALAAAQLIEDLGGIVAGFSFLVDLAFLDGRKKLKDYKVHALVSYDSE